MRDEPTPPPIETATVHHDARHDSAPRHVSGAALYVDDLPTPPNALHLALGLSEVAHAKLLDLNLDAVRSAPGVLAVLSAADIPGVNDVSPVKGDDPMFAETEILHHGQCLFAVAAENRRAARAAARLGVARVEERPAVLTIEEAIQAGALLEPPYVMARGDAAAAIAAAPHQLSGRVEIGGQEHLYLEGQAALALPGEGDEIKVICSTQHPTEIQHKVASVLGVPYHSVIIEVRRMGGAFGGKESQGNLAACAAALAAVRTGRPAKLVYDRDDDMRVTGKRHDFRIDYRVGFDERGVIQGIEVDQAVRCGMSWDLSEPICDRAMFHADNAYHLPAAKITSYRCRTHTASNTAFRGFGGPQGMVGIERVIDEIAFALGEDPLTIRRRNFYPAAAAVAANPAEPRRLTQYGMAVEDFCLGEIVDELAESAEYAARRAEIATWNAANPVIKRGIALTPVKFGISFTKSFLNQAGALVHVYTDGSVQLNHGGTEMGQGLFTKVAQVVAEEFGVALNAVKITATDTSKVPNTSATAASSGADLNGMAAQLAAREIKDRISAHLAAEHQTTPDQVSFANGQVRVGHNEVSFAEAAQSAYFARVSLSATGYYATPKISWDKATASGRPFFYFAYGAAVTEAAIDTLTGENRLLRVDILHDCGRSLNPALDLGQIEGGYVQGAGWLTMEELVWDDAGRLRTHAPSTYKIPCASDRPEMNIKLWERGENREETIYRSKAVGEPPLMLGISALMALSDAVASVGDSRRYPNLDAPATPERVLMAVERMRAAG
ncbi:MAG: xanthine dehydrogenase molybdopterin binding subunit [Rhodobacteraceae bacterium]|nr:xanthine dehydrogenase molybdopterin binding subunit [Paracoccaceae bacterium]